MDQQRLEETSGAVRRLLALAVGLLLAVLGLALTAGPATAQTRIGPQSVQLILPVGPHDAAAQSIVEVRGPPLRPIVSATAVAAKAADGAAGGGRIVMTSGRGTTYDVPEGWAGRNAHNGKGLVYQRSGAIGNADSIRIMEPTGKYPDGYVRVYNSHGRPVDAYGKPGPPADTHIWQTYNGPWPGWPN